MGLVDGTTAQLSSTPPPVFRQQQHPAVMRDVTGGERCRGGGLWATATSLYSEDFRKYASGTVGKAKPPSYLSTELPPDIPLLTATNYQNDFTVPGPGPHRAAMHEVSAQVPMNE